MRSFQQTIASRIHCSGIGVHTGQLINMTLEPADAGTGIVFRRTDVRDCVVAARYDRVADTMLGTTLQAESGEKVATVEHLMAAFWGAGVDNVIVELDGPEIPIMDGSSAPFLFLIDCAGVVELDEPLKYVKLLKPVSVREDVKHARLEPASRFSLACEIDFKAEAIGRQSLAFEMGEGAFRAEIARARTFGFAKDIDRLRELGLARGGSLENAVVVDGETIVNEGGLRFADEFVRHKALDVLGDLYLAGGPLLARLDIRCPGHAINNRLLRQLFADPTAYAWVDAPDLARGVKRAAPMEMPLAATA